MDGSEVVHNIVGRPVPAADVRQALKAGTLRPMNGDRTRTEGDAVKRIQIVKPVRRPADAPLDLRSPSGKLLPF